MNQDPEIKKALGEALRLVEATLRSQAPRKIGTLRDSIKVTAEEKNGNLTLKSSYKDYGVYLDWGTKNYNAYPNRGRFNPKPGKGRDGIKPRFWTTLDEALNQRVKDILIKATKELIKNQFKKITKK